MQYRKFLFGIGSLALALAMAIPSYAAKQVIPDQELDEVTAAGQPVVLVSGGGSPGTDGTASDIVKKPSGITDTEVTNIALGIQDSSQQNLRALILNNVAGENQTGNGMNIASGSSAGRQDNNITQSWGSTYDADIVKGTVVSATVATAPGGDASCNRDALICKPVGGNGSAVATSALATPAIRKSIYSDQVLVSDGAILYAPVTVIAMDIRDTAQQGLAALIVNNVSGLNQVANAVNISGGLGTGVPGAGNVSVNGAASTGGQGNVINQFRGTPYSRPQ